MKDVFCRFDFLRFSMKSAEKVPVTISGNLFHTDSRMQNDVQNDDLTYEATHGNDCISSCKTASSILQ